MSLKNIIKQPFNFLWQIIVSLVLINNSKIGWWLRKKIYHTNCSLSTGVVINNRKNFQAGDNVNIFNSCHIINNHGFFSLGNHSHLGLRCLINAYRGQVVIGNHVAVGSGTQIFSYSNHYETGKMVTEVKKTADVLIKNNILIGANCTILPGAIINDNVVVGAGSVVKGELEANSIYAGIPCQKIKSGWYETI